MNWLVWSEWNSGEDGAEHIKADTAEEAAERFMEDIEKNGCLHDWIEGGGDVDLYVKEERPDSIALTVRVTVDWDPSFSARLVRA